jgi:hypothetical protein
MKKRDGNKSIIMLIEATKNVLAAVLVALEEVAETTGIALLGTEQLRTRQLG